MKLTFNKSLLYMAVLSAITISSQASVVRGDVYYQEFRNFAENRGKFEAGNINIPIYNTKGQFLGNLFPNDVPMPDFSAVEKNFHVNTLVHPQYTVSVKHNSNVRFHTPYGGLTFGTPHESQNGVEPFRYKVVARNDHPIANHDFNTPRLHKMVTEVASAEMASNLIFDDFRNNRFETYARVGTGTQDVLNEDMSFTNLSRAYMYPIGGSVVNDLGSSVGTHESRHHMTGTNYYQHLHTQVRALNDKGSPMPTYLRAGDSGSPLFGFDRSLKRWVLIGLGGRSHRVSSSQDYGGNYYALMEKDTVDNLINSNVGRRIAYRDRNAPIRWQNVGEGLSLLTRLGSGLHLDVAKGTDLNNGKDLIWNPDSSNQPNTKVELVLGDSINQGAGGLYFFMNGKVSSESPDTTWVGSGIYVDEGKTVEWKVKNPEDDRMSKLGKGELLVNGTGVNNGSISIGDGKLTLAQQADNNGNKRAFREVQLASGRPTVVLADGDQLNNTKLSFGYRGGTLDMNGSNLELDRIHHMDDGATITNSKNQYGVLTLNGDGFQNFRGTFGHTDSAYLSINYLPKNHNGTLAVFGNVDVKGYFNVNRNGKVVFAGMPIEYAGLYTTKTTTNEYNWRNRQVKALASFYAKGNSLVQFGRNISDVVGDFKGGDNGQFHIGFINNVSLDCYSNETCRNVNLASDIVEGLPMSNARGDLILTEEAKATIGKAHLYGGATARDNSQIHLTENARWTLTRNSEVRDLILDRGSKILLNPDDQFDRFNTLSVNGRLSGEGYFRFSTSLADLAYNKLILNGEVQGNHKLSIVDSGKEPNLSVLNNGLSGIRLVQVNSPAQNVNFTFEKVYVNAGAYRYVLNKDFTFSSPIREESPVIPKKEVVSEPAVSDPVSVVEIPKPASKRPSRSDFKSAIDYFNAVRAYILNQSKTVEDVEETYGNEYNTHQVLSTDANYKAGSMESEEIEEKEIAFTYFNAVRKQGSQADVVSTFANNAIHNTATAQRVASQAFETFAQHGITNTEPTAVWIKTQHRHIDSKSADYRGEKQKRKLTQIGAEFTQDKAIFGFGYSDNRVAGVKQNNVKSAGVYVKHQWDNGLFAVVDAQFGRAKTQQHRQNIARLAATGGVNMHHNAIGFTPYVGVALNRFSSSSYNVNEAQVQVGNQLFATYHAGVKLDYTLDLGSVKVKPFIATHYVASNKKQRIKVNNEYFSQKFDNRLVYQAGTELKVKLFSLEASAGTVKGRELKRENQVEVKVGFTW